jgi:hypothetical protein
VWQYHLEQTPSPFYNSATIILPHMVPVAHPNPMFAHRLLVVTDPPSLMTSFLDTKDTFVRSGQTQHAWDADHERLRILAVVFSWIVNGSCMLIDKMTSRATEMVMLLWDP